MLKNRTSTASPFHGLRLHDQPARNLTERGFESDFGVTLRLWFAFDADFSVLGDGVISGAGTINGSETIYAPTLINLPFSSQTYTFAAGSQFYLRKWKKITLFGQPGFGLIHERANINLPPQLGVLLTTLGTQGPTAHQTDTTYFGWGRRRL